MPKQVYPPPVFPCSVEGCGRPALSPTTRLCRRDYYARWRARHPDYHELWKQRHPEQVAEYRARENAKRRRGQDAGG